MAWIPDDAKWYLADVVLQFAVEGDTRRVVHVNQILISADSPDEAFDKALEIGQSNQDTYENPAGKQVTITFHGLKDLLVIHDNLEHGAELSYSEKIVDDDLSLQQLILPTPKHELGVFSPLNKVKRPNGPDCRSKEVVDAMTDPK